MRYCAVIAAAERFVRKIDAFPAYPGNSHGRVSSRVSCRGVVLRPLALLDQVLTPHVLPAEVVLTKTLPSTSPPVWDLKRESRRRQKQRSRQHVICRGAQIMSPAPLAEPSIVASSEILQSCHLSRGQAPNGRMRLLVTCVVLAGLLRGSKTRGPG